MSYTAVKWAMYVAPMLITDSGKPDVTARIVLIARAERAGDDGRDTYAAHEDVHRATGLDVRTIQRAERRLEKAGLMVRDGVSRFGTPRWHLDMKQAATDADKGVVEDSLTRRRRVDAERKRRQREREQAAQSIDADVSTKIAVTDSASVTSRISNPDVTDSASGCHGRSATRTTLRTTHEPPEGTTLGGTLPPSPLRHPSPPAPGTYSQTSLAEPLTPAQDREGESLPREDASRCGHGLKVRLRPDGSPSCQFCRRGDTSVMPPGHLADVIHLRKREVS